MKSALSKEPPKAKSMMRIYDENYHSTYAMNRHVWIIDAETGDVLKKSI